MAGFTFVPELDNPILKHKVRQAIRNLRLGKACGLDDICGEVLKPGENLVVLAFVTKLFNTLYDASCFPVEWCKSVIIPLPLKGDDTNPNRQRDACLESLDILCL